MAELRHHGLEHVIAKNIMQAPEQLLLTLRRKDRQSLAVHPQHLIAARALLSALRRLVKVGPQIHDALFLPGVKQDLERAVVF